MTLLAGTNYDPAAAVSKSTASLLAMTAIDTTNLRLTFTAPANGSVFVRIRAPVHGATTYPQIYLGVLDGAAIKARCAPVGAAKTTNLATSQLTLEVTFTVTGLTAGQVYIWDAAYAVELVIAATGLKYGGPDNTTTDDAFGGISYEVWSADGILGSIIYDPGTAVAKGSANTAMAAFDTTNARLVFTVPPSGKVLVRIRCNAVDSAGTNTMFLLGVMEGATVKGRAYGLGGLHTNATGQMNPQEAIFVVAGLTPGTSTTWDAAWGSETNAVGSLKYGGPNDTTTNNAWAALQFEIWDADYALPPLGISTPGRSPRLPAVIVY